MALIEKVGQVQTGEAASGTHPVPEPGFDGFAQHVAAFLIDASNPSQMRR